MQKVLLDFVRKGLRLIKIYFYYTLVTSKVFFLQKLTIENTKPLLVKALLIVLDTQYYRHIIHGNRIPFYC
jgi:hypothetical protein